MSGGVSLRSAAALARRDLRRYFSNPSGYVFITLFILLSAAAAFWRPRFFLNNLANLDQLTGAFAYLLLFFIPALCMGLWADERKQGTDELLLTLPLTDADVVLGKILAVVGVYSVSLAASLSHAIVLAWLGNPDPGLLAATFFGYWLMGVALVPLALLGSILTANPTIAFILGALLCAVPVGLREAAASLGSDAARLLGRFSLPTYAADFTRGLVSLDAVLYFAALGATLIYLNVVLLGRRHWQLTSDARPAVHRGARVIAIGVSLSCMVVLAGRLNVRVDLTAEQLYSLSEQTRGLLAGVPADRPVIVQAFVSPEVPESLVQTRENLLGTLREIEAIGGARVAVAIQNTEPYSEQARLAQDRFGISPRTVTDPNTGQSAGELYLAVAVISGGDEQVIPFFDRGLSAEYELARAIRVVSGARRKRVGIIDTDVRILGGVDYRQNRARPGWSVVQELTKQYDVVEVAPADAPTTQVDALVVVLPSRMTQTDLDVSLQPVLRGVPTLLLLDPLPVVDINLAPAADLANQIDPFRPTPAARVVYGDIRGALARLGLNWVPASVVYDSFNPHPDLGQMEPENVFVASRSGSSDTFNRRDPVTAGLSDVLMPYPGYLMAAGNDTTFEPLLQAGVGAGASSFFDLVQPSPGGMVLNPALTRAPGERRYVLAARVRGEPTASGAEGRPLNIIAIADLDFVSDYFFNIRLAAPANVVFDNVTFFLNAIDQLAGDLSFIPLRERRARHRTLERVEAQTRSFVERRTREEQQAENEAAAALADARSRVRQRLEAIAQRTDLDAVAKQIVTRNLEATENRQLQVLEASIEQAKNAKVRASREAMEAEVRRIRTNIRTLAVLLPPLPILAAGAVVFMRRARREREGARALGRLREIL
jgi:ABC-2 type transport system permease protein